MEIGRFLTLCAAALLVCATGCATEQPPPHVAPVVHADTTTLTYQVQPFVEGGFEAAMVVAGLGRGGSYNAGHTRSRLEWTFSTEEQGKQNCVVGDVMVRVHTTMRVPTATLPPETSPERRAWWDSIVARVVAHEAKHGRIAEEAGRELATVIDRKSGPTCATAESFAKSAAADVMRSLDDRQRAFDAAEGPLRIAPPPP
jgi:predicted secreted Zn-dependent protease